MPTALPDFELGPALTEEQLRYLDEHGLLRFRSALSPEELRLCREELERLAAAFLEEDRRTVLGIPLLFGEDQSTRFVSRMAFASHYSPTLATLLRSQRFEPIRALMGSGARLMETERFGTYANDLRGPDCASSMGWHTDGVKELFRLRWPSRNLQVCLHLDDQTPAMGGVRVLAGTHEQGLDG